MIPIRARFGIRGTSHSLKGNTTKSKHDHEDKASNQAQKNRLQKAVFVWRRPTLPGRCHPSTIGAKRLYFCVRNGYRCFPLAIIAILSINLFTVKSIPGQAYDRLVFLSFMYYYTSTWNLSTTFSSWGLQRNLILRGASCLDAFSTYPCRT